MSSQAQGANQRQPQATPMAAVLIRRAQELSVLLKDQRKAPSAPVALDDLSDGVALHAPTGQNLMDEQSTGEAIVQWKQLLAGGRAVVKFDLSGARLTEDGAETIKPFLSSDVQPTVEVLDVSDMLSQTSEESARNVMATCLGALRGAPKLRCFVCNKNALEHGVAQVVADFLKSFPEGQLKVVSLVDAGLDIGTFQSITKALEKQCESLETLAMAGITSRDKGGSNDKEQDVLVFKALASLVEKSPNLRAMDFGNLKGGEIMCEGACSPLIDAISKKRNIKFLSLAGAPLRNLKHITCETAFLAGTLGRNLELEHFDLSDSGINSHGVNVLLQCMISGGVTSLRSVVLECVEYNQDVAANLGLLFKTQFHLAYVNVSFSFVDDDGLGFICEGILASGVKKLDCLNVAHNDFDEKGYQHIAKFVQQVQVNRLFMEGNGLVPTEDVALAIKQDVEQCGGHLGLETPMELAYSTWEW